jgi:hypothetical protein
VGFLTDVHEMIKRLMFHPAVNNFIETTMSIGCCKKKELAMEKL